MLKNVESCFFQASKIFQTQTKMQQDHQKAQFSFRFWKIPASPLARRPQSAHS